MHINRYLVILILIFLNGCFHVASSNNVQIEVDGQSLMFRVEEKFFGQTLYRLSVFGVNNEIVATAGVKKVGDNKIYLESNEHSKVEFINNKVYKYSLDVSGSRIKGFFYVSDGTLSEEVFVLGNLIKPLKVFRCTAEGRSFE